MKTATDIMTSNMVTIGPNQTISHAVKSLLDNQISGLPVVEADGRLIGVISEFALLVIAYDPDSMDHPVRDHMTCDVITIDRTATLREIADSFIVHRIRRLPVVDNGHLVGMISRRDVLRAATLHGTTISDTVPV